MSDTEVLKGQAMQRRTFLATATAAATLSVTGVRAQSAYPGKPIKFVIPFTAGSSTDIMGRTIAERMAVSLGQPVIVENRPGAGGTIAAAAVAKSDPDGYTVLVHSGSHAVNPAIYTNLQYDTLKDFTNVGGLGAVPNIIIAPQGRYKTLRDLVAAAKAKPNQLNFASAGIGSATHLNAEKFMLVADIDLQHVPFKGTPEAVTEIVGGRLEFYCAPINAALGLIKDGKVAALATSGARRSPLLPDVPTSIEAGFPDSDFSLWVGAFVPSKTPAAIVQRLHAEIQKAAATPEVKDRYLKTGTEAMAMTQPEFDAFVRKEIEVSARIAKRAKMQAQ
jgi:tripartite-type tricarboxylate transporter receptor subunit TctC